MFELFNLKTPCNIIISGTTTCGKTTLLRALMVSQLLESHDFTLVLCPTAKVSGDYEVFNQGPKFQVRYEDVEQRLDEVIARQKKTVDRQTNTIAPHLLVILDDCIGEKFMTFRGKIDKFSTMSRHYNITFVILTQSLKRVPETFRLNTRYLAVFSASNFKEQEKMLNEFVPKAFQASFQKFITDIYDEPYTFVFCQCHITQPKQRLWVVSPSFHYKNIITDILEPSVSGKPMTTIKRSLDTEECEIDKKRRKAEAKAKEDEEEESEESDSS